MMMACSAAPLSPANGALNLDLAGGGGGGEGRVRRDGDSRRSPRSRKVITMKMTIDSGEFVPERRESVEGGGCWRRRRDDDVWHIF